MKQKIIFFDIDGTIFDAASYLNDFYNVLAEKYAFTETDITKIRSLYTENKAVYDHFNPQSFLENISKEFNLNIEFVKKEFWNVDLFNKNIYKDTPVIRDLSKIAVIGIFSKGNSELQKRKISFIVDLIDEKNIFIFPNKINHINEVFELYSEYDITLVDDKDDLLAEVKKLFPNIRIILIDRNGSKGNLQSIKSLDELALII